MSERRDRIRAIRFTLVTQASAEWPREACGMVVCHAGETISRELGNIAADDYRFEADPRDLYELEMLLEQPDHLPVATWHSHCRSGPWMSEDDYRYALLRPELEHVIVGRAAPIQDPEANYGARRAAPRGTLADDWVVRSYRVRPDSLRWWEVLPPS